jgi:hypothetical protein
VRGGEIWTELTEFLPNLRNYDEAEGNGIARTIAFPNGVWERGNLLSIAKPGTDHTGNNDPCGQKKLESDVGVHFPGTTITISPRRDSLQMEDQPKNLVIWFNLEIWLFCFFLTHEHRNSSERGG